MERERETINEAGIPETGTPGRLRTRLSDRLMVRVAEHGDDQLWLLPLAVKLEDLQGIDTDTAILECANGRGLVCVEGEAHISDSGMIRFRVLSPPEIVQRRRFVRLPVPAPVSVIGRGGLRVDTSSVNLSGGGMLLEDVGELEIGDRIHFQLELEADKPTIDGWAVVVRLGHNGERGFEFEDISRKERERLIHFLFDRQRAARSMGWKAPGRIRGLK